MAQKRVAYQLDVLQKDIDTFRSIQTRMNETVKNTYDEVNALTAMWEGGAHDVFQEQFKVDYENTQKLLRFLNQFLLELEDAKVKYARCESDVNHLIQSLKIM